MTAASVSKADDMSDEDLIRTEAATALSQASTEDLLLELRRRIIAPATDAPRAGTTGTGLDPHGDWPEQG